MGDLGEFNRHDRALSQTRALSILCKCMAQSIIRSANDERARTGKSTKHPDVLGSAQQLAQNQSKGAIPRPDKVSFTYSRRPIFHTYILTWL